MSDIVPVSDNSELLADLERVEQAGTYAIKGYSFTNIAELLSVTRDKAKWLVNEYYKIIAQQAEDDPFFLEKIQFNTIQVLKELDEISKEAWETVTVASDEGMVTARVQALKLAHEIVKSKAQLKNLMTGGQKDSNADIMARTQRIETVNQMLSEVLREVISGCPRCSEQARISLAEAFSLMKEDEEEIQDAELVD